MITSNTLTKLPSKRRKRLGRGEGSRRGKNATFGHKGQKKRNPSSIRVDFEGGQSKVTKRTPKFKGFKTKKNKYTADIPVSALVKLTKDKKVNLEDLITSGIVKPGTKKVRIVLKGALDKKFEVEDDRIYLTKGVKSLLS